MKPWLMFAATASGAAAAVAVFTNTAAFAASSSAEPSAAVSASSWIGKTDLPDAAARILQSEIDQQLAQQGGTQVSPYEISYGHGGPIMVFANPVTGRFPTDAADRVEVRITATGEMSVLTTTYRYGCPYSGGGWSCFYQNVNFNDDSCPGGASPPCSDGGRLLQFQSCGRQSLATYGFSGQTSSWVNNTSSYVSVYDRYGSSLWQEAPGGLSAYVGDAANDRADNFWIIC